MTTHQSTSRQNANPVILHGDWLTLAKTLVPSSVDMLYADPPFNTGVRQATPPGATRVEGRSTNTSYGDDFGSTAAFIDWLRARLLATLPALKPTAAIMLHCDWRTSHRVRCLLEEILGERCFVNHLIWRYGLGGSSPRRFARKHDDILYYSLDPEACYFDPPRVAATSQRLKGQSKKATDVIELPAGAGDSDDVLDVPSLNNMARERTGYPTQKPVALLKLLIGAACPPGGLVLDPCAGSGTTLVAAQSLGRGAIGFDVSEEAVRLANQRLERGATSGS